MGDFQIIARLLFGTVVERDRSVSPQVLPVRKSRCRICIRHNLASFLDSDLDQSLSKLLHFHLLSVLGLIRQKVGHLLLIEILVRALFFVGICDTGRFSLVLRNPVWSDSLETVLKACWLWLRVLPNFCCLRPCPLSLITCGDSLHRLMLVKLFCWIHNPDAYVLVKGRVIVKTAFSTSWDKVLTSVLDFSDWIKPNTVLLLNWVL